MVNYEFDFVGHAGTIPQKMKQDAQFVADILPTTMIFVPSIGGHSHCEIEKTPLHNCLKGANVLLQTILDIDKK